MQDIDKRLDSIEGRLFSIEKRLGITQTATSINKPQSANAVLTVSSSPAKQIKPSGVRSGPSQQIAATHWMAWCAGFTFILAVLYFLKLVYDTGWLTPMRQIGIAYLSAVSLVTLGFYLNKKDHQYAAYLPAVGLVVLYLTTFIAHLYYQLLPHGAAIFVIGGTTFLGIWLGRRFDQSVYVIFSAVGVYITPLLVDSPNGSLIDLIIYYSAWSLLFSFCAIQEQRRITYLLPLYLAMLGFDAIYRMTDESAWQISAIYQFIQFVIFGVTTVLYSIFNQDKLDDSTVLPHGLALFIFYSIEYSLLQEHIPDLVNYFALASGGVVYILYKVASHFYSGEDSLQSGATLVSYYCSWVAVHAIFLGEVDQDWLPWAVLCAPLIALFLSERLRDRPKAWIPVMLACGTLFVIGYAMLLGDILLDASLHTPKPTLALFIYMFMLYGVYYQQSRQASSPAASVLMLYAGHLAFIACLVDWVKEDIFLSALWGIYGVALLLLAIAIKDKVIGKSALLIFSVAAFKVLLFDLSSSNSMTRVLVLLVLSISLYAGGWLYQSLTKA